MTKKILNKKQKIVISIVAALLIIALGVTAYVVISKKTRTAVALADVTAGDITETLKLSGTVNSENQASFEILDGTYVKSVNVRVGDAVKKGDVLGFRQCFFVASIWCIVGLAWFVLNWKNLQGQGVKPFKYLTDENGNVIGSNEKKEDGKNDKQPLTKLERNRMIAIILVSALSVIFWLFYYQQDLALVIYMTDYVKMSIGSFDIPPSWVTTTWNGLLCVVLGGVMAAIWKKLAERPQGDMNMFKKVALGFLFVGLAFGVMVVCELVRGVGVDASVKASVFWPFLFVTVITIGEMCFSPLRNAFVSKYAPKKYLSLLMGVIAISTFGANKLSPFVQAFIEKFDVFPVFVGITVIMLVFTALIFLANKKLNSLVEGKEEA